MNERPRDKEKFKHRTPDMAAGDFSRTFRFGHPLVDTTFNAEQLALATAALKEEKAYIESVYKQVAKTCIPRYQSIFKAYYGSYLENPEPLGQRGPIAHDENVSNQRIGQIMKKIWERLDWPKFLVTDDPMKRALDRVRKLEELIAEEGEKSRRTLGSSRDSVSGQ